MLGDIADAIRRLETRLRICASRVVHSSLTPGPLTTEHVEPARAVFYETLQIC